MPRDAPGAGPGRRAALAERATFAAHFLRAPLTTASVTPSSTALADATAAAALDGWPQGRPDSGHGAVDTHPPDAPVVVELGAGSGAFTRALAARRSPGTRQVAVEISPDLAARLPTRAPGVEVVVGDVAALPELLADHGVTRVDVVVSGLGWAALRPGRPDSLLAVVADLLGPRGRYVQLAYQWTRWAAPARALEAEMRRRFTEVTATPTVWRNLPPAVMHRACGPRPVTGRA